MGLVTKNTSKANGPATTIEPSNRSLPILKMFSQPSPWRPSQGGLVSRLGQWCGWHQRKNNVVQSRGQHCRKDIAPREPCEKNCQQGFEAEERREPKENTDCYASGNRHWSIPNGQQLQRMFTQPAVRVHVLFLTISVAQMRDAFGVSEKVFCGGPRILPT